MRPILFAKDATDFNTNGVGRIDCLSCIVTEERNGQYELEAVVPEMGQHVSEIELLSILAVRHDDSNDLQPFRVYEIKQPINGKVTIYAQHLSYQLANIPTMPFSVPAAFTACGRTLELLRYNAAESCPFTFWTDVTTVASYDQPTPATIWQRLKGTQGSVLDQFGGEYEWDKWTVKLHKARGTLEPTVSLRYGKNITDIDQEKNIADTITGVCPYWINTDGTIVTLPEKVIESDYADRYPFRRTVPLDLSQDYESAPTVAQLRASARAYINQAGIGLPKVSIKVSFVQLWQTEEYKDIAPLQRVKLCDYVGISFERLGISEQAKVVKTKYDVLNERYESMELGSIRSSVASTINSLSGAISAETSRNIFALRQTSDALKGDIANATAWLTGSNGYVMAVKNSDGTWKELLFLDHPDVAQAVRVLRINENGIGFSSNGVAGPYTQAWTLDGKLVIGGTNVPSLTVYKQNGAILFRISKDGIEWTTDNSSMFPSGRLVIRGGSVDGGTITGTLSGDNVNITQIDGGNIKTGTIDAQSLKAGTITAKEIKAETITANEIKGNTVTGAKIAERTIGASNIKSGTITNNEIKANTITANEIKANTITANEIATGAITADKIAAKAISGDKISGGTITGCNIMGSTSIQLLGGGLFQQYGSGTGTRFMGSDFYMTADLQMTGDIKPTSSGVYVCGGVNRQWSNVNSALFNGKKLETTSDRNLKHEIEPITEVYERLFFALKPVKFRFNDGDRVHIGAISQDVEEALYKVGLTDMDFGGFDKDVLTKLKEPEYDEEGHPVYECDENGRIKDEEIPDLDEYGNVQYRYSLSYLEFIMLNTHMIQKLYTHIDELEEREKKRDQQISELIARIEKLEKV